MVAWSSLENTFNEFITIEISRNQFFTSRNSQFKSKTREKSGGKVIFLRRFFWTCIDEAHFFALFQYFRFEFQIFLLWKFVWSFYISGIYNLNILFSRLKHATIGSYIWKKHLFSALLTHRRATASECS